MNLIKECKQCESAQYCLWHSNAWLDANWLEKLKLLYHAWIYYRGLKKHRKY